MSDYLKKFSSRHKGFMKRSKSLISSGDWHLKKNKGKFDNNTDNFSHENRSALQVVERLAAFIKGAEGERQLPSIQKYIENVAEIVYIHLNKIENYYDKNDPDNWTHLEKKKKEEIFQQVIFKGENTIVEKLDKLNISNNYENIEISFHSDKIAPIPFKDILEDYSLDLKEKIISTKIDWDEIKDKRFFKNIPEKEIPKWNPRKHFFDQDNEVLQFFASEWCKIKNGYEVDGYYVHPFLYWHLNYFKTNIPKKDSRGVIQERIQHPTFRRNEWYFTEIIKKAEKLNRGAVFIFGSRRIGKSVLEASYLAWKSLVSPNAETSVTISNDEDRVSIASKIQDCYKHLHPAFKPTTNKDDWESLVELGLKTKSTNQKIKHCNIRITNLASGSKKASQKGAGGAPVAYIYDESGKADFIDAYNAAKYSFKTPEGWKTLPIFTGTGSNVDISKDAELVLNNPEKYDFLPMDWELLEYKVPKEFITWNRRPFAFFMPGQLSYEEGLKLKKLKFSDFLEVKSEILSEVEFYDADWEHNSTLLLENQKKLKKEDRKEYQAYCVFLPTDPEHCLMSAKNNPFQPDKAKTYKTRLENEGLPKIGLGRPIELYRDTKDPSKIRFNLSDKELPDFPHKGGNIDAPFILFDDFPEEKPEPDRYISSFDDYKHEKSSGDSLGAFGIFDRLKRKLVLTLATRPDPHSDLHVQIHMAIEAFNAKAFPENADLSFVTYLKNSRLLISEYLEPSFDMYSEFSRYTSNNRSWGWTPGKDTTPRVMAFVVNYATEVIDIVNDKGETIGTKLGLENIPDPMIIEEMIKYKETGNYDRLIMFGGILLYDHYLTYNYRIPRSFDYNKKTEQIEIKPKPIKNKYFRKGRNLWRN